MENHYEKAEEVYDEIMRRTGGGEKGFDELVQTEPFKSYLRQKKIEEKRKKEDHVRAWKVITIVAVAVGATVWLSTGSIGEALSAVFVAIFFVIVTNILGWL